MIEKVAEPTVGRIVHFYEPLALHPLPAMVVEVIAGAHLIPVLHVFNHSGGIVMENVPHLQDQLPNKPWWDWMPYQKGQAAKTEALQSELDKIVQRK